MPKKKYQKIFILTFTIFCAVFLFQINDAQALTPIARVDVVPYQRIEYNTTFNFGVVAFSKAGIDRIEFTITGQGYTGGVKTATTMAHNPQTDVWEYWVPIASNEFTSNGPITISSIAYGEDNGIRNIGDTILIVEATSAYNHTEAWVDGTNSDGTGTVGDINDPYPTIASAVAAAQVANGGNSDGNIIYLENGIYSIDAVTGVNTVNEWLTISRADNATKENVIINEGRPSIINHLKIMGITIQSRGESLYVLHSSDAVNLWVDDSRIIGAGRTIVNSSPIMFNSSTHYSTNNYTAEVYYAYNYVGLVRDAIIENISNDAFQNTAMVINSTVDYAWSADVVNIPHVDVFQLLYVNQPDDNIIVYGLKATDIHYQGSWINGADGATNMAFVNVAVEMREPAYANTDGGKPFTAWSIYSNSNHLLMWHCTFPYSFFSIGTSDFQNSSFIGNYYWAYRQDIELGDNNPSYAENGNSGNNEFLYNHYENVYQLTPTCVNTSVMTEAGHPCPHYYSKKPDSHLTGSATYGNNVLHSSYLDSNFLYPKSGSVLIDRIPFATVPVDIYGNSRTGNPDVGAVEYISAEDVIAPVAPTGLGVL